jgi:hypothetical protein
LNAEYAKQFGIDAASWTPKAPQTWARWRIHVGVRPRLGPFPNGTPPSTHTCVRLPPSPADHRAPARDGARRLPRDPGCRVWRAGALARVRALIQEANPRIVEEWKWMGTPVRSHHGIVCTAWISANDWLPMPSYRLIRQSSHNGKRLALCDRRTDCFS